MSNWIIKNRVKKAADLKNFNEEDTIEDVKKDNLDIAVDLMGYTSKSRTYIFSNRVAPIQINYLGYPGTMGSKVYDFILSDEIIIPKEFEKFYFEKVLKLKHFLLKILGLFIGCLICFINLVPKLTIFQ